MTKTSEYRTILQNMDVWTDYLLAESGLPGPRGNLELLQAVADLGSAEQFYKFLEYDPQRYPVNHPGEFLACCGAAGLGRLAAEGKKDALVALRRCANDPRWRVREGVVMGLERLGLANRQVLIEEMGKWVHGSLLEQRAVAAGVAQPTLLKEQSFNLHALALLEEITRNFAALEDRKSADAVALKKGLAYCWSVVVAAEPVEGKRLMESWLAADDPLILWIMKENLTKKRLERMDPAWVKNWQDRFAKG
jgi:hypothetical protein